MIRLEGISNFQHTQRVQRFEVSPETGLQPAGSLEVESHSPQPFEVSFLSSDPVRDGRELGDVKPAHQEAGGLAKWLGEVPDHRFYGPEGKPDYNGILADLARESWATLPDSLEDGRLPNISSFQRSVARERQTRDSQLQSQLYVGHAASNALGFIVAEAEREQESQIRVYSGTRNAENSETVAVIDDTGVTTVTEENSVASAYTVVAPGLEQAGGAPIHELQGGLSGFLQGVPDGSFYNEEGHPDYNGLLARLARQNGASDPRALEDGTLPNISTFQRAVAKERGRREAESRVQTDLSKLGLIMVVDSGIDYHHRDLDAAGLWQG